MTIDETLATRVRQRLFDEPDVVEKPMFGALCFMLRGKMLLCVQADGLLCRIGREQMASALARPAVHPMESGGRTMSGYVTVEAAALADEAAFDYWFGLCLDFNRTVTVAG